MTDSGSRYFLDMDQEKDKDKPKVLGSIFAGQKDCFSVVDNKLEDRRTERFLKNNHKLMTKNINICHKTDFQVYIKYI